MMENIFICDCCKVEYDLSRLWYDPYQKIRHCKDCHERIYKRKINECIMVECIDNWLEGEEE